MALLGKDNITLGCSLPTMYPAMAYIAAESFTFDPLKLRDVFFADSSKVMRTDDKNKIIFAYNNDVLTIDKSDVQYIKKLDKAVTDVNTAKVLPMNMFQTLILFLVNTIMLVLMLLKRYKDLLLWKSKWLWLFNNYFTVVFNKDGSQEVDFSYRTVVKQNGSKRIF